MMNEMLMIEQNCAIIVKLVSRIFFMIMMCNCVNIFERLKCQWTTFYDNLLRLKLVFPPSFL